MIQAVTIQSPGVFSPPSLALFWKWLVKGVMERRGKTKSEVLTYLAFPDEVKILFCSFPAFHYFLSVDPFSSLALCLPLGPVHHLHSASLLRSHLSSERIRDFHTICLKHASPWQQCVTNTTFLSAAITNPWIGTWIILRLWREDLPRRAPKLVSFIPPGRLWGLCETKVGRRHMSPASHQFL